MGLWRQTAIRQVNISSLYNPSQTNSDKLSKPTVIPSLYIRGVSGEKKNIYPTYYHIEPTETSKQPIRTCYLGHVTGYQPIRDQYFLIRSVPGTENNHTKIRYDQGDFYGAKNRSHSLCPNNISHTSHTHTIHNIFCTVNRINDCIN
eukprot:sb/3473775/